jgi:hypothetical protein
MSPLCRPINVKRPALVHRFEAWSPKLSRRLTVYSREAVSLWVLLEADPRVVSFCERPGYVRVNDHTVLADFWLQQDSAPAWWVMAEARALEPFDDAQVPRLDDCPGK